MAVYRRSNRHRFLLVLLVLTSVTILTLDQRGQSSGIVGQVRTTARDLLAPVQTAVASVFKPLGNLGGGVLHYSDVKAENAKLRRQLEAARAQAATASDAERERKELLQQQQLQFAGDIPQVSARVVSTAPSNFQLTVGLNRGRDAGVEPGMPVVTGAGLVGKVVDASRTRSTVLLVTDPSFNVGIRFTTSGDVGVAKGAGARQALAVDFVDVNTKVGDHEIVVTSGLQQSVFPPAVPVGRVASAHKVPGLLQQDVRIDPIVDLRRLEFVKVLKWKGTA